MMKEKWIWAKNDEEKVDSYAEFIGKFKAGAQGEVLLDIAALHFHQDK